MNSGTILTGMIIQPWQADLYDALQKPLTMADAARSLAHFDNHRRTLEAKGELAALAGIATPLRQAVLELAGVAATSPRMLARKVALIMDHHWTWAAHPMATMLIEAAVISDVAALRLSEQKEKRLLQRLRGDK